MAKDSTDLPIEKVLGVGAKSKKYFHALGIKTLRDLIYFLPRKILDLSNLAKISNASSYKGRTLVISASVKSVSIMRTKIKKMWIVQALLQDQSGAIEAIWYNQPFMAKNLHRGETYVFNGEIVISNQKIILNSPQVVSKAGYYPIYPQTKNLTSRQISKIVGRILTPSLMPADVLPPRVLHENKLPSLYEAARLVHQPKNDKEFSRGRFRFLFEELFLFAATNQFIKREFESEKSFPLQIESKKLSALVEMLDFKLTADQQKALSEVVDDLKKDRAMNRLIQGDVGSGKTIIAFLAAALVAQNNFKAAILAPTEILALQHFETFSALKTKLKLNNLSLAFISAKSKKIPEGANIFIGTHALLNQRLKDLALVVVDEQQRFGVKQRNLIAQAQNRLPHYLSLSATPIPRSLAHVIFSNCDLSLIRQKPTGRAKIKTYLIPEQKRHSAYKFVDGLIAKNQQAFIICPLIKESLEESMQYKAQNMHESDAWSKKAVEYEVNNLKKTILGKRRIALLHGRLKSEIKEKIMADFKDKKLDILVSTSLLEVGIDIAAATVMIIEDADSFGLSQLHQFRGRVGRSNLDSYCFIFSNRLTNPTSRARLKAFVQNDDGFELANFDLKLRGPGVFFGAEQTGFKGINPLWFEDSSLLKNATASAKSIFSDLDKYPLLKSKIKAAASIKHLD